MKRNWMRSLVAIAMLSATGAWAVAKGGNLYIKSKDTKVLKEPKAGSPAVTTLQPGAEVVWNGASEKDKQFHEIASGSKKGFVLMSNLSPNKPQTELPTSDGKPLSAEAFASSAAATKALTPAAVKYADGNPSATEAAGQIIYAEEHNRIKGTPEAINAHAKAAGLPGDAKK